jgi:hypothetical protein
MTPVAHFRETVPGSPVHSEGDTVARNFYEVRVTGALGPASREAFADLVLDVEPMMTVLTGDLEQAELHALLDRVRALGLELVDLRQAPTPMADNSTTGGVRRR